MKTSPQQVHLEHLTCKENGKTDTRSPKISVKTTECDIKLPHFLSPDRLLTGSTITGLFFSTRLCYNLEYIYFSRLKSVLQDYNTRLYSRCQHKNHTLVDIFREDLCL
nr:MAG TPA: hypothetical protein [Inoviridae sp.]